MGHCFRSSFFFGYFRFCSAAAPDMLTVAGETIPKSNRSVLARE